MQYIPDDGTGAHATVFWILGVISPISCESSKIKIKKIQNFKFLDLYLSFALFPGKAF
jgi:hypothetical protein